ncbi:MAG: hypothetical protein QOI80_1328 [Solirubrobacteraceae bacterium]|nr:hypothetical protein [Solirubrobacteraceae bacterium]
MPETGDRRRRESRQRVKAVLRERGPLSRRDIAEGTGLSRPTVASIVAELAEQGIVHHDPPTFVVPGGGRPAALVRLAPTRGVVAGLDFGKRHLRVGVADLGHTVRAEREVELAEDHGVEDALDAAGALLDATLADAGADRSALIGAGMGIPGPIDARSGEPGSSTILPMWVGMRAAEVVAERLGVPVHVDNDANLGALAEWTWGAATGCSHVAYLKVSTGIGAGLIIDGRPYKGSRGTAGEIGHTVVDRNGPLCRCGNRGCLETLVGAPALLELVRPALGEITVSDLLMRAVGHGDPGCVRVLGDAGAAIGGAVATLCNLVNPERIVVGGELSGAGEILIGPLREALRRACIPAAAAEVVPGSLGARAEVLGAIALALRAAAAAEAAA